MNHNSAGIGEKYYRHILTVLRQQKRCPKDIEYDQDKLTRGYPISKLSTKKPLIRAAVLVPIIEDKNTLSILLTKRTDHLENHPGQISFPGGRLEEYDSSPIAGALRETEEEIGLSRHKVEIIGYLDDYVTGTGFKITPIIGWIKTPITFQIDDYEVAELIQLPLEFLLMRENHNKTAQQSFEGFTYESHDLNFQKQHIWGATAGILMNLFEILSVSPFHQK
jgi:8-oxo-dGTP pyrophosphatase MutT (NUDIX family)